MVRVKSCDDPRHKHIEDFVSQEIICVDCDGVVVEDETEALRLRLSPNQEAESTATNYYPVQSGRINRLGTQHHVISKASPGLIKLTYPWGVKDKFGEKCEPVLTPYWGYQALKFVGMNGRFEGNKMIVDYERDAWFRECSQTRLNLVRDYNIDEITADRLARKDLQGYSTFILEILPELITRLSINMIPSGRINKRHRKDNRKEASKLIHALSAHLDELLTKGDKISDREDGLDVPDEQPVKKKGKTVSIIAGNEEYVDADIDLGGV